MKIPYLPWMYRALRYTFKESCCLGVQHKEGGRLHLRLNTGERPIANKYREGKMKSTLERELKVREIVEREALRVSHAAGTQPSGVLSGRKPALICAAGEGRWECGISGCVIAQCWIQRRGSRNAARLMAGLRTPSCLGCWRNGSKRPVLKHGPRSLTCMRVFGWQTHTRNESECRWDPTRSTIDQFPAQWRI